MWNETNIIGNFNIILLNFATQFVHHIWKFCLNCDNVSVLCSFKLLSIQFYFIILSKDENIKKIYMMRLEYFYYYIIYFVFLIELDTSKGLILNSLFKILFLYENRYKKLLYTFVCVTYSSTKKLNF